MDRPMRRLGPSLQEIVLSDLLAVLGVLLIAGGVAAAVWDSGLLAGATAATGLTLALAGAGLRQNRAALDVGVALLLAAALAWLVHGIVEGRAVPIVAGALGLLAFALVLLLRRAAVRGRFKPRFFSPRGFETMVQIADTMIDGDGREAIDSVRVAINADHLLAEIRSPATQELKTVLFLVEWVLPLRIARPFPFSSLGSHQRRRAVAAVIGGRWIFRDMARSLKVLASAGYYGDPETMHAIGYVPYEERPETARDDRSHLVHLEPGSTP
jgi:hypothetical protein